ncbi:MAG: hypothetical protein M3O26_15500 [Pseudomonadota bacterium]|nr:hypothetical protein [Pseudomonadota bacterium]
MRYVKYATMALSVMFIVGCSSSEPPPAKTVFEPMTREMERAQEVQKTVDDQADKTRKEIENQERGDNRP